MRRWRQPLAWLGWALAAVLLVGVGGSALAASLGGGGTSPVSGPQAPAAVEGAGPAIAGAFRCGHFPRACRAARRAPVRGELTVPVPGKPGTFEQVVFARGEVTAVSATSISVKSADGQVTTFAVNGDTKFRRGRAEIAPGDVTVGSRALVSGPRSGQSITARRVHVAKDKGAPAPTTTTTAPTTTT
jgi:hypothetical protein